MPAISTPISGNSALAICKRIGDRNYVTGTMFDGNHIDAETVSPESGGNVIARHTTEVVSYLNRPMYNNNNFQEGIVVPRELNIDYSLTEVAVQSLKGTGKSSRLNGATTSVNVGQVSSGEDTWKVFVNGLGYEGTIIGRARADRSMGMAGTSLAMEQADNAGQVVKGDTNFLLGYGEEDGSSTGFFNDPNVTLSASTLDFTSFATLQASFNTLFQEFLDNGSYNGISSRLYVSPRIFGRMASTYAGSDGSISALNAIMNAHRGMGLESIVAIREAQRSVSGNFQGLPDFIGNAGEDRCSFCALSPQLVRSQGSALDQFPEVQTELGYKAVVYEVTTEMQVRNTTALYYFDQAAA